MNNDTAAFATQVIDRLPVRVARRDDWVQVRDGTWLSVRVWIPEGAELQPTGVVLEAVPYRKDDVSMIDDETRFGYFAGHGIACARLDLRGSGSSGGVLVDEYTLVEQADLLDVIEWLAQQSWCNGSVGMIGISWSGFNALQVAARRPSALKAIVTACASDDRYDNDVHYLGGVPLGFYMNLWGTALHLMNMRPPRPSVMGADWLAEWENRLHSNLDFTALWLAHQQRDRYWRQGSVCEEYEAIRCPVLLVGGWADNYTDSVFRLLEQLPETAQAIVGPWGHTWPERPEPGPGIDFLDRCLRWWRHWLNGEENDVRHEPRLSFYVQDFTPSREDLAFRPGRWWGVNDPRAPVRIDELALGTALSAPNADDASGTVTLTTDTVVGAEGRHLLPMGVSTDLPGVQDSDDELSVVFESAPLTEEMVILGSPLLKLAAASDAPTGHIFVRLNDVDPDGHSHLVTRGALNLTHRRGHAPEDVAPLEPGITESFEIPLKATSFRFSPGHRIRLALSTTYWPWLWPAPDRSALTVAVAASTLHLPVLDESSPELVEIDPGHPLIAAPPDVVVANGTVPYWTSERTADGWVRVRRGSAGTGTLSLPDGWTIENLADDTVYELRDGDPTSASMRRHLAQGFRGDGHHIVIELTSAMTCDSDTYTVANRSEVTMDGALRFRNETTNVVPRAL